MKTEFVSLLLNLGTYFIPFLAVSTAMLILYTGIDNSLEGMNRHDETNRVNDKNWQDVYRSIEERRLVLYQIRRFKLSIIVLCQVLFFVLLAVIAIFVSLDIFTSIPYCIRIASFTGLLLNIVFLFVAIIQIGNVMVDVTYNVHKIFN